MGWRRTWRRNKIGRRLTRSNCTRLSYRYYGRYKSPPFEKVCCIYASVCGRVSWKSSSGCVCTGMYIYTSRHFLSSLSFLNLPISLFCFVFFLSSFSNEERRSDGGANQLPPPSFLFLLLPAFPSFFFAAAVPPARRGCVVMTMATTCHWSSFGRPVPNWTHVSVA